MKLKLRVGRKVQGTFRSQDTYKAFVSTALERNQSDSQA